MKTKKKHLDLSDIEDCSIRLIKGRKLLVTGVIQSDAICMLDWSIFDESGNDYYNMSSHCTFDSYQSCLDDLRKNIDETQDEFTDEGTIIEKRDDFPNYLHYDLDGDDDE